jgi:transcriptional regulator with XRE-family HTH domain
LARVSDIPNGKFAQVLAERMEELNLSIKDVSDSVGATYEHVRQLIKGASVPSKYMVSALSKTLKMDEDECQKLATGDRIRVKYGKHALRLIGRNPELEPLEAVWHYLSSEHKEDLIAQAKAWAKRDKNGAR